MPEKDNIVPFERPAGYWVRKARRHQNDEKLSRASALLREAYRKTGDRHLALELAETCCQMGCNAAAQRIAEELLEKDPGCSGAYYILGLTSLAWQDERLADDALATCLIRDRAGEYAEKAQAVLNDYAWRMDPVFPRSARAETLHLQGLDAYWAGNWEKAEDLLVRSAGSGKRPQAETLLGETYLRQGRAKEALPLLQRAMKKLPGRPTQRLLLAQTLCALGRKKLAAELIRKTLPDCRSVPELALAAESCLYAGRADLICEKLLSELAQQPQSNDLRYLLGAVYANNWELEKAIKCFLAVLSADPDDRDAAAALKLTGLGPVPLDRPPAAPFVYSLCARPPLRGDPELMRLCRGLTICLGGALRWQTVFTLCKDRWRRLNPVQKRACDRSPRPCWPWAFYLWLRSKCPSSHLSGRPALYRTPRAARRIRRMVRYLRQEENWRRIK